MKPAGVLAILAVTGVPGIAQPFVISTFAGGGLPSGPALNAPAPHPRAIASDGAGSIYFAASSAIYKVDSKRIPHAHCRDDYFGLFGGRWSCNPRST
jgi:hypothetical protein